MGRPVLVTDAEIIAAGERIKSAGPVNGTQLWTACGKHGRAERLLAVWNQHEAKLRAETGDEQQVGVGLAIPEKAQRLAASLKSDLSSGIDRVLSSIFSTVEESVQGRYRAEVAEMTEARDAYLREIRDAYAAMEEMSDAVSEAEDRVKAVEGALSDALNARNVSEALRTAAVEEQARQAELLRQVEGELKRELFQSGEAKASAARADSEAQALSRTLDATRIELQAARDALDQALLTSASTRDTNVRQAEVIVLKDLEIKRLRDTGVKAEKTLQMWMERALGAERLRVMTPTELYPATGLGAKRLVRRPRIRGRLGSAPQADAIVSDTSGTAALIAEDDHQRDPDSERLPR